MTTLLLVKNEVIMYLLMFLFFSYFLALTTFCAFMKSDHLIL